MSRFRALPYAKALFDVVERAGPERSDQLVAELEAFTAAVEQVPDFVRVLVSPAVATETKTAILDEILDRMQADDEMRRFLRVVQSHYRLEHMADITAAFRELVDRARGRSRATIETAVPLEDARRKELTKVLSSHTGGSVLARFEENPELLAGFRARIGSLVFDGSLAGQVDRLSRETLMEQG